MAILRSIFNFHYYEPRFQRLGYIFIVKLFIEYFLLCDVTITDIRKRTVKTVMRRILRIRERITDLSYESCGRYIVGTLTNKVKLGNISL